MGLSSDLPERGQGLRIFEGIGLALLGQRGHLFAWGPVGLGGGIGLYFLMPEEPDRLVVSALVIFGFFCAVLAFLQKRAFAPLIWLCALLALGFGLAAGRADRVGAPVLEWRYYGAVQGRIIGMDRSASDALRLTLADVTLENMRPDQTPAKVRVALHGEQGFITPSPGMSVMMTAHLSPPSGPVEPGGFDFQRHAWFKGIGAVGYTRTPVLTAAPRQNGASVFAFRMKLSKAVQARMSPDVAGVAAALTTGDRSGLDETTVQALRASNLAHLLAISGLHMGLLAGVVFAAARLAFALLPAVSLRLPAKKIAAGIALGAAAAYLVLSGGSVATQRAFVMAAVALIAVILDRRALSLRAVALAGLVILCLRPEALLSPGFQMSFAATTALVAVFAVMRDQEVRLGPKWVRAFATLFLSSLVAGLATAPYAASHFNVVSHYGLPANLVAMPVMGLVVAPSAVLAVCLVPLGLEGLGLWAMEHGLRVIMKVAKLVSEQDGAQGFIPSSPPAFLPVFSLGMLWLILWQGHLRWMGVAVAVVGLGLWGDAKRPDVLISDTGGLVGVLTPKGRALSKDRGQGFVALNWLENDGENITQPQAATRWPEVAAQQITHVKGKRAVAAFQTCPPQMVVVANYPLANTLPCQVYDADSLRRTGAIALYRLSDGTWQEHTARAASGRRLWNTPEIRSAD